MEHIISYFKGRNMEVYSFSNINSKQLLMWGNPFYSQNSETPNVNNSEFTIYFPYSPVNIKSYEMRPYLGAFPMEWKILVSHDNSTWKIIHTNNDPLCDPEYQNKMYK